MLNCFYDCYSVLNKVYGEKTFLKQALLTTPTEPKNRAVITKICYGVLDRDIELSYYITCLAQKTPKLPVRTILKIAMYSVKYLGKHAYAVLDNAVELTKKLGKGGASGFVNAFLRKFLSEPIELPKEKIKRLSVEYSYPEFLIEELIKDYGEDRAKGIISAENSKTCLSFYGTDGEKYLKEKGYPFIKTAFDGVFLSDNFVRDDGYDKGIYTYQSIGSVAICGGIEPCGKILDCCAAPGGKSVRLSYKCKEVYSWDIYPHRVSLIEDYKKRMNRENIKAQVKDSKVYFPEYEGFFDAVLCDAPCSGTGIIADNPDVKLNRKKEDIKNLEKEQISILKTVCRYVKKGGFLYYSTCSVLDRENLAIIKSFMSDVNGFEICGTDSKLPHLKKENTLQFLPDISSGAGFYFAKLKRFF